MQMQELLKTGSEALSSLKMAKEQLDSARNWGIADILGGGIIISLVKHGKMQRAAEYLREAETSLKIFGTQIKDLDIENINLETGDLLGILDVFGGGFLVDLFMQSRINEAGEAVENAIIEVSNILEKLEA